MIMLYKQPWLLQQKKLGLEHFIELELTFKKKKKKQQPEVESYIKR